MPRHQPLVMPLTVALVVVLLSASPAATQASNTSTLFDPRPAAGASRFGSSGNTAPAVSEFGLPSVPAASGAGTTGFDSTNTRRTRTSRRPARRSAQQPPVASAMPPPSPPPTLRQMRRGSPLAAEDITGTLPTPVRPRRVRVDDTPFEALGWRAGAFLVKPAVELWAGHDSNAARRQGGSGASMFVIAPELVAQSDWSRHSLSADLRGSYTSFGSGSVADRPVFNGVVDGRLDATRDTSFDGQLRFAVASDSPDSPNVTADLRGLPLYTNAGITAGVTHRLNRLEMSVKGSADRLSYEDSHFTDNTTQSNADRNYKSAGFALRAGYEAMPGLKPFAEVSFDTRRHDETFDRAGYRRDSTGRTIRAGVSFDLPQRLTGQVSAGYTSRNIDDPRLDDLKGLVFDASLVWSASALTTVTLTAKSAFNDLVQPELSGYLSRDVGVRVDHAFRRWLIGTMRFNAGFDKYECICLDDQRYLVAAGFTYKATRSLHIKGEVRHEWLTSNNTSRNYSANVVMLGVRLQK